MSFIPNNEKTRNLLLLYITKEFPFPLTEDQFLKIILDNKWMSFFDFKESLTSLVKSGQIEHIEQAGLSVYELTKDGEFTLLEFESLLPLSTKQAFLEYVKTNQHEIKQQTLLKSNYTYLNDGGIEVECHARDKNNQLLTIKLYTNSEQTAKEICSKWEKNSPLIYQIILDSLLK